MEKGKEVYYIQRVRILDGVPLIIDHNYFLKEVVTSLSVEIAEESIYRYLEEKIKHLDRNNKTCDHGGTCQ